MIALPKADCFLRLAARGARTAMVAVCAIVAGGLGACGGPTRAVEIFKPSRLVVLGDELSRVEADGRRYGINGLESDGVTVACAAQPVWSQSVANVFGVSVCPAGPQGTASLMRAQAGAQAADLAAQVDGVSFTAGDLVTVLIGYNDVLSLHATGGDVLAADARGRAAGAQICRVLASGARVVSATVPDLGLSPLGRAQGDGGMALTRLTDEFNKGLRVAVSQCRVGGETVDGWQWGLLLGDEKIRQAASLTTLSDVTQAACLDGTVQPNCTTATLKPGASASGWLWATDTLPSPAWHGLLGDSVSSLAFYPI